MLPLLCFGAAEVAAQNKLRETQGLGRMRCALHNTLHSMYGIPTYIEVVNI